jgi:hypothetical protein
MQTPPDEHRPMSDSLLGRVSRRIPLRKGSVLLTYPGLGVGNYLYFLLDAYADSVAGPPSRVLDSGFDPAWRAALPRLEPLLAGPKDVAWRRVRHIPPSFLQAYGVDFSAAELERFVREALLPTLPLPTGPTPDVVINVRRGDYYAKPDFRRLYGFDTVDYVHQALEEVGEVTTPRWLSFVSDDPAWCAEHFRGLAGRMSKVTFGAQSPGSLGDFVEVAAARTLVLTNSTFSYWAGYTSDVLHGDDHLGTWVPDLHQRGINGDHAWQHDPQWRVLDVRELEGSS